MSNINLLNFLKDKKGRDYPLKVKIKYGLPLTDEEKKAPIIRGSLDLMGVKTAKLPDNLKVLGNLLLSNSNIDKLPSNLYVRGMLLIGGTKIKDLPDELEVKEKIWVSKEDYGSFDEPDSFRGRYGRRMKWSIGIDPYASSKKVFSSWDI